MSRFTKDRERSTAAASSSMGLSIRAVVLMSIGTLAVLAVGLSGWRGIEAWRSHSRAVQAQAFDAAANQLIAGLYEVLIERLATNNGLQAPQPASAALIAGIEKHRKVVAENFTPGLEALSKQDFPNKPALLDDLRRALENANQARAQADAALKLPRDQRNEALRKNYIPTITASVDAALKLWLSALHTAADADPELARLATIKEIGWMMRDLSGRERSNISQAIAAGQPIPVERVAENSVYRGQVDVLWRQLQSIINLPGTHQAIRKAIDEARTQYFGGYVKLADDLKAAGAPEGKYPVDAARWGDISTPQIGSLLGVMYAAGDASKDRTAVLAAAAVPTWRPMPRFSPSGWRSWCFRCCSSPGASAGRCPR